MIPLRVFSLEFERLDVQFVIHLINVFDLKFNFVI